VYEAGLRRPRRLPCRVVSVGSIVVGGVAKTPAAAWIATGLARRGHSVVLGSRGYGRQSGAPPVVVSDGRSVRASARSAGDEPLLLAARAPGVPVLVDPDRARLGWRAVAGFGAEVLVLDDGFQHHALERDVDVVLLDASQGFGNGRCLPRGPLREAPAALGRADAIGVVDGSLSPDCAARVAELAPAALGFAARRRPLALRPLGARPGAPGSGVASGLRSLAGRDVGMLCGLARPASLRRTLQSLGARVVAERCFADHHRYRRRDLRDLARHAPLWVTTEKDAVKLQRPWAGDANLCVLAMRLEVSAGEGLLDFLEERLAG